MLDRPQAIAFDVDRDSLVSLRRAFPDWEIRVMDGATTGSLTRDWNPGRADLLRALIGRVRNAEPVAADDRTIRSQILAALEKQPWAPMTTLNVTVSDGVADVWGTITNEEERHGIRVIAENTPGVKTVNDHLVYIEPYTGTVIESPDDTRPH